MPLQNRVDPFGNLFAAPARGTLMGNRGGRFHTDDRTLTTRRWASRQWICCVLDFKNRQRDVWGRFYTELFFLDEVTAFAAGHRPCFECRRRDAEDFARLFADSSARASAGAMDDVLNCERLNGKAKRLHRAAIDRLPDGGMIAVGGEAFALRGVTMLPWTPEGYGAPRPRPRGIDVDVLTPPSILAVLRRGYAPRWHVSAG
ncbi:MAG TPA: hypothetical protein VGV41_06965 [Pseudolabrys sp.]|uniref:hypothetical protein n=1 Tax=Pseudolabrys sp. TaxID=1960880 RepID=UPI002DDCBFE2|nr:hypothetical protein [Pseudolabrys sp.]HEV2628368.1 hypothetical protein [Pseudolabrys sp.]